MIKKMKKWLGIEGVKMKLILPAEVIEKSESIEGKIQFESMNPQTVTGVHLVFIEKYMRGKGKEKLIDEYELGTLDLEVEFEVSPDEVMELAFELPFVITKSEMDDFGAKNFFYRGISTMAKKMRGATSTYRIEAEASVKGVALNPFDRVEVVVK